MSVKVTPQMRSDMNLALSKFLAYVECGQLDRARPWKQALLVHLYAIDPK